MKNKINQGARIVAKQWLELEQGEALLIVTCDNHKEEAEAICEEAKLCGAKVEVMSFPEQRGQVGHYFDEHEEAFDEYDVIVGATTHSLVTTKAAKRAVSRGSRFLSLPLSTNDNRSLLEYDFLKMDPKESHEMAKGLLKALNQAAAITVNTEAGTRLTFGKQGRDAQVFTGATRLGNGYSSASFELFIPIEETKTEGIGYVDGSLGYQGKIVEPAVIHLEGGKIVQIDENESGKILSDYLKHFEDDRMYVAGEFGIGLNRYSKCEGNCYIEDESMYGTFHIGFGRNIALGGIHEAKGHFDLVFHRPDIYADDQLIMKAGEIVV